jgi:mono/diheme cytochrome c family protein
MRRQASLRPFEREMPPMPAGTVSREGPDPMPAAANAKAAQNPLTADAATLARGRLYYTYYCAMCHGEDGRGRTPVGEAYWPRPTDLTSAAVQRLSGGELYRAMLTGPGHDPVLLSTVARDRRWPIVLFLRTLGAGQAPEPNG